MAETGECLLTGELLDTWRALEANHRSDEVAGLFRGWKSLSFGSGKARILYVGKASSGDFDSHDVHATSFNGKHSFWDFARQIAERLDCTVEQCIAWSNISKLSRRQIKADAFLVDDVDLLVRTLKFEIKTVNPDIVVFVSAHFNDEVVRQISSGELDFAWNRSENETADLNQGDVWWRKDKHRAYLWMRHPQGAGIPRLRFASDKIAALISR